jgi:quercetin dioxygenase-like cupin family protein
LRRKDSLRGADTAQISVRLGNYSASHFEGSAHTNLTVVLTVLKAGAVLDEHHAPAPVTLLPLFGEIVLAAAEGLTRLTLAQGTGAVFAAHLPHRVEAQQDSAFILVMGGQA